MATAAHAETPVEVRTLADGRVLWIAIDAPKGNVLTMRVLGALTTALLAREDDHRLKLVVLQGAGGNFSYGASVEEHRAETAPRMLAAFHATIRAIASYPAPVAAVLEGKCLGGGFELALACNLLFATRTAVVGCPEIKLGVFPPVLAAIGARRLGGALAERLVLSGATIDGEALDRAGALTALLGVNPEEDVLAWYEKNLATTSASALRLAVRAARLGSGIPEAVGATLDALEQLYVREVLPTHDANEGVAAFLERRPPVWRDA